MSRCEHVENMSPSTKKRKEKNLPMSMHSQGARWVSMGTGGQEQAGAPTCAHPCLWVILSFFFQDRNPKTLKLLESGSEVDVRQWYGRSSVEYRSGGRRAVAGRLIEPARATA